MADTYTFTANKDTYLNKTQPTVNNDAAGYMRLYGWSSSAAAARSLLSFDIASLYGYTITSATLKIDCYSVSNATSCRAKKCTRNDWVESEATWNVYKAGNNWTSAGGDSVATSPAQATFTPADGWNSITVTEIVQDACTNSISVNFLLKLNDELPATASSAYIYGRTHATLYPYLEVVVTPVDKTGVTENSLAFASSSVSLEQTTYAYSTANNDQAYVLNLRTNAWSFIDQYPFSNAIYRPSTQELWGARRDTGNLATMDSGTTFDGDTITWTVQTGFYNFGQLDEIKGMPDDASQALKRLKAMYAEVRSTGNITLTVYTEQDSTGKTFTITPTTADNVVYNMVRTTLSRDIRGKYVSFKFSASVPVWVGETGVKIQARELK